jgi:hypothetical protein
MMGLAFMAGAFAQGKKKDDDKTRIVHGTVTDADDKPVEGAVVQLENTKNQQIRSFVTRAEGTYVFHGLDPNVDYVLRASYQGSSSPKRTLSAFDSRKDPVVNLKLEEKK